MRKLLIMTCCAIMLFGGCSSSKQPEVSDELVTTTVPEVRSHQSRLDGKAESYKGCFACDDYYLAYITEEGKVHISFNNGKNREVKQIKNAVQIEEGMDEIIVVDKEGNLIIYSVNEDKIIKDFPSSSEIDTSHIVNGGGMLASDADWKKSLSECSDVEKLIADDSALGYYIAFKKDNSVVGRSKRYDNFQDKVDECVAWENIVKYVCDGDDIMGLKKDGTVICTNEEISSELAEEWTDIIDIEASGSFLGLKADGTVLSLAGELEYKTLRWTNVKQISASLFCAAGLKEDGTVVVAGRDFGQDEAENWTDIVYVQAADTYVMGIKENGEIVTTPLQEGEFKLGVFK